MHRNNSCRSNYFHSLVGKHISRALSNTKLINYIYVLSFTKRILMSIFNRLSNGWQISMNSFKVLRANKQLIIFPILSSISLMLVLASFVTVVLAGSGWDVDNIQEPGQVGSILVLFLYYLVNYFVVVFFNMSIP